MNCERGDSLYVNVGGGPAVGKVLCHGKDGVTVDVDGKRHQVRWDGVLGRKASVTPKTRVVDQGIDGAIVEHADGRRAYVRGLNLPEPDEPKKKPGVWETLEMRKAVVLFMKAGPVKDRPGLRLEEMTDRAGHRTRRWKRTGKPAKRQRPKGDPEATRGTAHGYGTGNIQEGDAVRFETPDHAGEGRIVAMGEDGATVKDAEGREHKVLWEEIRHRTPGGKDAGARKARHDAEPKVLGQQKPIPAERFTAADYAKSHDQADVTPEAILAHFPDDTKEKIAAAQDRLKSVEQTIEQHKRDGQWNDARRQLHARILDEVIPPELEAAARPSEGEQPTFIILGGRGGSGKSSFRGVVYDPAKCVVLDADHIKGLLPEYEGWNAWQVHEESGEIFDHLVEYCRVQGLNVVLDKTMKTAKSAIADVKGFKAAGYRTEAHYMHLPRQESAKRAVSRFLNGGEKGRYVPVEVILQNTANEAAFDQVKQLVDAWSFRDNNVPRGEPPILISQSVEGSPELKKALSRRILFMRRKPA